MSREVPDNERNRRQFLRTVGAAGLTTGALATTAAATGGSCDDPNPSLFAADFDPSDVTVGETVTLTLRLEVNPDECLADDPRLNEVEVTEVSSSPGIGTEVWFIDLITRFDQAGEFNVFAEVPLQDGSLVTSNTVEVSVSRKFGVEVKNPRLVVSSDRKTVTAYGRLKNIGSVEQSATVELWEQTPYDPLETKYVLVPPYEQRQFDLSAATRDAGFGKLGLSVDGEVVATDIPQI